MAARHEKSAQAKWNLLTTSNSQLGAVRTRLVLPQPWAYGYLVMVLQMCICRTDTCCNVGVKAFVLTSEGVAWMAVLDLAAMESL